MGSAVVSIPGCLFGSNAAQNPGQGYTRGELSRGGEVDVAMNGVAIAHGTDFTSNQADSGGACWVHSYGTLLVYNSTFSMDNGADGGAVFVDSDASVQLSQCTFVGNLRADRVRSRPYVVCGMENVAQ